MARLTSAYTCQSCGYSSPRWIGKCPNCAAWNTFVEEIAPAKVKGRSARSKPRSSTAIPITDVRAAEEPRITIGIPEFDRVLGGGVVHGSAVLVGGDPGIGKSTLMMQMACSLRDQVTLYVTGEESVQQLRLRANRLDAKPSERLLVLAETDLDVIGAVIENGEPDIIVVDSIQTMERSELESPAGTVSQVREATARFVRIAKEKGTPVFLVGHVTKEGVIAGPRVVEHMVDTVLHFEGERHYAYRILRSLKNRFGSTNEIGIFEMHDGGLREVVNPSQAFLAERKAGATGSTVVATIEGTRPLLVEVQALVAPTSYGVPQRTPTGFDTKRLQMLLAVLEKRAGVQTGLFDVFVNVAGGVRVDEPAVDLGMALAVVSSLRNRPVDPQMVAVGEVGLGGEVRAVSQMEKRIAEAGKLGFARILVPRAVGRGVTIPPGLGIEAVQVETVDEAIEAAIS